VLEKLRTGPIAARALLVLLRRRAEFVQPTVTLRKSSWADDVVAFAETCRTVGVPAAVERSRSEQGAHAWFFFAAPVAASRARKMGTYLLTQTMSRRHQLSMDSYDRLFPNQDTLPRGGFGNLIALPLQHGPRQEGNTLFVDDQLTPFPDQWAFLASVPRIDPTNVDRIARDATRTGQVVGAGPASALRRAGWTSRCSRVSSGRDRWTTSSRPMVT
jgi:hypothetical protein